MNIFNINPVLLEISIYLNDNHLNKLINVSSFMEININNIKHDPLYWKKKIEMHLRIDHINMILSWQLWYTIYKLVEKSKDDIHLIKKMTKHGYIEIVKLLCVARINPSDDDNAIIKIALQHNHDDIVQFLLNDPRVVTCIKNNNLHASDILFGKILGKVNINDPLNYNDFINMIHTPKGLTHVTSNYQYMELVKQYKN